MNLIGIVVMVIFLLLVVVAIVAPQIEQRRANDAEK